MSARRLLTIPVALAALALAGCSQASAGEGLPACSAARQGADRAVVLWRGTGITPVPVPRGTVPEHALAHSPIGAHPLPQGRLARLSGSTALAPIRFPCPQPDVQGPLVDDDTPAWVAACGPPASAYGSCPDGGTHLRLLLDESGSICAADPPAYRH